MSVSVPARRGAATDNELRRAFAKNGIPRDPDPNEPLPKRILKSKLFWLSVVMVLVYATLLVLLYRQVVPDREVPGGILPGLGTEAVPIAVKYAAITAIPLSLLYLWVDRFRPQRLWVWLMTFGWGACVATFVSAQVNTWAAGHLSIAGDGDPATGARAAIYVAPFVEEASKATVLFWLAILMRYQWVSRISGIVLAGLSGAAFAFTENILYYGRAYRYAARTFGQVPPLEALQSLFFFRGVLTFFGHPLFTSMTGIGLAVGLRSKSKIVRIVAPLAGFCAAAFLHMAFNTTASLVQGRSLQFIYFGVALPLVIGMIIFIVRQLFREGRLIRDRLTDYVRVGWLPGGDPAAFSRLRTRLSGAVARDLPRSRRLPGHHPDATRGHRARLPAGRDDPGTGRRRRTDPGEGVAGPAAGTTRIGDRAARRAGGLSLVPPDEDRRTRVRATELSRSGRHRRQLPGPGRGCGAVGADCYPVFGGRSQLEASRRVGGGQMASPGSS